MSSLERYRLLGKSGLRVSPLCLGTMTFGTEWGWGSTAKESGKILDAYLENGGNFIDTANYYTGGTSESMLGKLLSGRRDEVVLGTKYTLSMRKGDPNAGGNQRKNLVQSLEESLKRLHTDYIDLYWVHIWDRFTPIEETMRALDDVVKAGKVLYIGISDMPAWKIAQGNTIANLRNWSPFIALQVEYSLVERSAERDLIPMANDLGLGVMPWSPLGAALLSGKYTHRDLEKIKNDPNTVVNKQGSRPISKRLTDRNILIAEEVIRIAKEIGSTPPRVALKWLLERNGVTSVIIGSRTLGQLEDNLGCFTLELTDEHQQRLNQVSEIELGFPHDFIRRPTIVDLVTGGTNLDDQTSN